MRIPILACLMLLSAGGQAGRGQLHVNDRYGYEIRVLEGYEVRNTGPEGQRDGATFRVSALGIVLDGFTITRDGNTVATWNDGTLNFAGVAAQGAVSGTVKNCLITGNRTGIDINNSSGMTVRNCVLDNNHTGMILRNQTDNTSVVENGRRAREHAERGDDVLVRIKGEDVPLPPGTGVIFEADTLGVASATAGPGVRMYDLLGLANPLVGRFTANRVTMSFVARSANSAL